MNECHAIATKPRESKKSDSKNKTNDKSIWLHLNLIGNKTDSKYHFVCVLKMKMGDMFAC